MAIYDVRMPSGEILEIRAPDDATEDELLAIADNYSASQSKPEEEPDDGFLRQAADIPVGVARGGVQGIRFVADAFGADNPVSQKLKDAEEYLGGLMSASSKRDAEEISRIMSEAEDKGALEQVLAGLEALTVAPVDLISQAFGTAAPALVGGLFGMGLRTAAVVSGGMGAGITKDSIYSATKQELLKTGLSEDEAEARAQLAQQYDGENLDQILLGTGLGAISGFTGIERAILPNVVRNITQRAAAKSAVARAGQVALGEAAPEFLQAGQERVAANVALQREGFDVDTFQGALPQATLEGLVGGLLGGGVGALSRAPAAPEAPPVAPPVTPVTPVAPPVAPEMPPVSQITPPTIPGVEAPSTGLTPESFMSAEEARIAKQQQAVQQFGLAPEAATAPEMAQVTPSQVPVRQPSEPIDPIERQRQAMRVDQLGRQLDQATTEFDRQNIRAQIDQTLGVQEPVPQARFADLSPMDLRTATGRLNVLRNEVANQGGSALGLNVVPHPSVPNTFAIENRPVEMDLSSPTPDVSPEESQARIEAAEMAGRPRDPSEEARQVILSRALQNIEDRGGVASPEEAEIVREANLGQPYDRVDPSLSPQGTPEQQLERQTGIAVERAPRERLVEPEAEVETRTPAAPAVDRVIAALKQPAPTRSAEDVSSVRMAQQRYAPEDVRLMEQAARDPESLTEEGANRLNNIRLYGPRFRLADQVSPGAQQLASEVRKKLLPQLRKLGLGNVGLRLVETLNDGRANGMYFKQIITLALDSDNPLGVMRHEVIHALKELGAFTDAEWKALTKRARGEWINRFLGPDMVEQYRQQYLEDNNGDETGFQEYIEEEAIAEAFRFFEDTKPPAGMIQNLMRRLKNMFNAIKDFFAGNGLTSEDIFLSDQIFRDIEQGRLTQGRAPRGDMAPAFSLRSPLEEYISPEEAEGRIRRREAREPGTGAPTNSRLVFANKNVDFPIGKITKEDWLNRVQSLMSEEEIQDSRVWYQQLNEALTPLFGDQAPEYALAWLLSQKRASPTKGLLDVLRASDVAKGKQRLIGAGLNEQALIDVLSGRMPEGGVGAKLLDFVDSELGLPTRTVVRGDPRGRQPAAIDVWAQRDIGFVDNTVLEFIKKNFGEKAANQVQVDKTTSGEAQYEYGIDFYNDVVDMLNAQNFMGGGWTAREVQAVGWVTMQRAMGIQAEFVRDIIGGNTRRISIGLAPGEGSVMAKTIMGKEIPPMAAKRVITELAELANVRVRKNIAGVGAYLTYTEGAIQVDALASPEAVADLMDMVGYVFQQTEVINTRPLKSGKNMAIDIVAPKLKSVDDATKFFQEFLNLSPKDKEGNPIAPGFQQIEVDGQPGIRLLNFSGKWRATQVDAINQAIKQASQNSKIDVNDVVVTNVDMKTTKNDWTENHDGISYLDSLRNRGRLQEAELLQRRYPPSRFDLAGDGTIGWGGPRYSLRPDQVAFRPSDRGREGVSFQPTQPDARSYLGSHYGKARVNTLNGNQYGTGLKGAEAQRLASSTDPRIRKRVYFYIPRFNDTMPPKESGVGNFVYSQKFNNILPPGPVMSRLYQQAGGDPNNFESAVIDAGYDGYAVPDYGMMVVLNQDVPVDFEGTVTDLQQPAPKYNLRPEAKRAVATPQFKRWFGKSKVVDKEGKPMVMYHGTARDITEFRGKQAGAIFVTEDPIFAESFSGMSEDYMVKELFNSSTPEQRNKLIMQAAAKAAKDGNISKTQLNEIKREFSQMDVTYGLIPESIEIEINDLLRDQLASRANIMPVYVRAERPFDYANPEHVAEVGREGGLSEGALYHISMGSWNAIESPDVQAAIKDAGFDGFYILEAGRKNLAVYQPNQIKSATGNIGTYDESGDVRYSLVAQTPNAPPRIFTKTTPASRGAKAVVNDTIETMKDFASDQSMTNARIQWVDRYAGLSKQLKNLPLYDPEGTLRADMLKHAQSQIINLVKTGIVSGIPFLNRDGTISIQRTDSNLSRSEVLAEQLSTNKHVIDAGMTGKNYVAEIARALVGEDIINEDKRLNALGVQQLAEAKQLYKDAKALAKAGKMNESRRTLRRVAQLRKDGYKNKKLKRELQVDQTQIDWAKKQLDLVPEVKEILDIWRSVSDSLVTLWRDTGLLSEDQAQVYLDRSFYVPLFKAREDLNDEKFFGLAGVGAKSTAKLKQQKGSEAIRNIWENLDKQYASMVANAYENQTRRVAVQQLQGLGGAEITNQSDPRANLKYKDDGKVVSVIVDEPTTLTAFQTFSYELSPIMRAFGAMTQVLRAGALINPMFWLRQLIRDPIHATLVANSGVVTPFHAAGNFIKALTDSSPEARILAERGVIGQVDSTVNLQDFLKDVGRDRLQNPNFMQKTLHKLLQIHESSDAATRVSVFKRAKEQALKKGYSEDQAVDFAVFKARESINFGVMGMHPMLNSLRQMIPFLNATIVGLDTLYRAATGYGLNPEERAEAMRQFRIKAGVMVALSTVYALMYQDDEDYKKLPDYVKDNNFLIPLGTGEDKNFIKLAIPYEVGFLFKTVPEVAIRYLSGTSSGKEMLASYWGGLLHNLPTGGVPIPQAVRPGLEVITNYSFFTGRPIEGMSEQGLPTHMRGQRASEFAKTLSRVGLDKLNLSPAEIDYLIQGYFAELGTFSTELASSTLNFAQGKEPPEKNLEEMPFFRSFMTNPNSNKAVADFYEITSTAQETSRAFNALLQTARPEEAQAYIEDEEKQMLMAAAPALRKIRDEMAKVRKTMSIIQNLPDLSPEEKRQQMNDLQKVFMDLAGQGVELSNSLGIR